MHDAQGRQLDGRDIEQRPHPTDGRNQQRQQQGQQGQQHEASQASLRMMAHQRALPQPHDGPGAEGDPEQPAAEKGPPRLTSLP